MMDEDFLTAGLDMKVVREVFGDDVRLVQLEDDGVGWGIVYCTATDKQDVSGWWLSAWYLTVHFHHFPNGHKVVDKVWIAKGDSVP